MTDQDDHPKLADLHIDTIRRENDHVDQRLAELEDEIDDLESEVSTLEDEKADLSEEVTAKEQLIADFRDGQREKQLNRIREANEAVAEETEVDLSTLEDASVDQLETVAEMLENASGNGVSNTDRTPEVSDPEGGSGGPSGLEERKAEIAAEEGLAKLYADAKSGEPDISRDDFGPQGSMSGSDILDAATEGDS